VLNLSDIIFLSTAPHTLELQAVFDITRSLDDTQRNVEIYSTRSEITPGTLALCETSSETEMQSEVECLAVKQLQCSFCGRKRHALEDCPAKTCTCFVCGKKGHFAKVCRSRRKELSCAQPLAVCKQKQRNVATSYKASDDENVIVTVMINGVRANGLVDTRGGARGGARGATSPQNFAWYPQCSPKFSA